jgi:type I restriction enzyme M protein
VPYFQRPSVYGQESNQTTWKLSKMNLAIRNINSKFVVWNTEGSFLKDAHPDLKADYILANPPFNQKEWGVDILQEDGRWKYGTPPNGNANFAWMQHMLYHLSLKGVMATVLSNGSLSSNTSGEGEIRKNLVEGDLVECIVALPKQLFYNTGIPACLIAQGLIHGCVFVSLAGWQICKNLFRFGSFRLCASCDRCL